MGGIKLTKKLICEICNKELSKKIDDSLIIFKKDQEQKVLEVKTVCRGICDETLDKRLKNQDFRVGFKEMNSNLKYNYEESDFTKESLASYKEILEILNEIE